MRIALISEHASPLAALGSADAGGQNVYVAQTSRLLAERGHDVVVFTRRTAGCLPEVISLGPRLKVVNVTAGPAREIPKEELYKYMPRFADECEASMRREGLPDLVHAHFWMSGVVAATLKERLSIPFIMTFHALGRVRRMHQGDADGFPEERADIEEQLMHEAEWVVAECPQDVSDMSSLYAADPAKLVEVPCGFDASEIRPVHKTLARELIGIAPGVKVVLQLGRMVPRKGVDDAIRGFARATSDSPGSAVMLVVGGSAPDSTVVATGEGTRLQEVARAEGAEDRVMFLGSRSRRALRFFYSAADVFISVPWYEPFGITPVEAMACGVPVIGADVGGIKHTVAHGVTGLLVPPHDPDAVAEAVRTLLADDRQRERMGRAGVERVNTLFTWERVTEALEAVYNVTVAPPTPSNTSLESALAGTGLVR